MENKFVLLPKVHDLGLRVLVIFNRVHIKGIKHGKRVCLLPEVHDLGLSVLMICNQSSY